ncbi:MAG: tetratricopeptide repeat protein, partial [Xanthomonadales bacterium]|nr:tetratricopeptide repeat protein [Xanthomonadales bacterium]
MSSPQQVIQLAQAGRIQEALQLWDRLARQRPRDPNLLALGGNLYGQAGNLDAARRCFKKALKSDKRNVQAHMGMGQLLRTRGEHLEAVKHLRMAHQASPADLGVANNLALSLRESGRAAEGVGILKRYVDKTDHPGTRYNYANLLLAAGDAHAARKQFLRLRDAHPDNASALNGLGMAEFGCGNAQAAMEAFEKALELDPQSLPVLANFARACEQVGAFDRAAEGFQKWLELQPEAYEPRVRLANAYGELQRHEDALELLDRAIGQAPDRPEAYRDKSAILEQINRLEEAWATLEQALDRVGSDPVLALMRGRLLRRRKQPEEAIAALEAEHPESPELQRRRAHELALAHDAAGQFDLAWKRVEDFNRLTSTEPPADPFLDSLVERSEAQGLERLKEAPQASEDGTQAPIFVVGLPRSGTTLLGRILGAHSGVHELEESPYLSELARSVDWPVQPLDEAQRAELRARYFDAFDAQGKRVV